MQGPSQSFPKNALQLNHLQFYYPLIKKTLSLAHNQTYYMKKYVSSGNILTSEASHYCNGLSEYFPMEYYPSYFYLTDLLIVWL